MTDQPNKPVRRRGANEVDLIKEAIAEGGYIAVPDQEAEPEKSGTVNANVDHYFDSRADWKRRQREFLENSAEAAQEKQAQEVEASEAPQALTEEQIRALTPSQRNKLVDDVIEIQGENDELTYRESEPSFAEYVEERDAWEELEADEDEDE